jgi:hypothetical protein
MCKCLNCRTREAGVEDFCCLPCEKGYKKRIHFYGSEGSLKRAINKGKKKLQERRMIVL